VHSPDELCALARLARRVKLPDTPYRCVGPTDSLAMHNPRKTLHLWPREPSDTKRKRKHRLTRDASQPTRLPFFFSLFTIALSACSHRYTKRLKCEGKVVFVDLVEKSWGRYLKISEWLACVGGAGGDG
jgi:hypothetical protein